MAYPANRVGESTLEKKEKRSGRVEFAKGGVLSQPGETGGVEKTGGRQGVRSALPKRNRGLEL